MTEVELDPDMVRFSLDNGVTTMTPDAPAARNILTVEVIAGVRETLDSLPDVARCVIVRRSDEADTFYVDGDVNAVCELQADTMTFPEAASHVVHDTTDCVCRVYECDLPTVAAIDGPTVGAGAALAITCDLQPLCDDAAVSFSFRRVGLTVNSGVSYLLP